MLLAINDPACVDAIYDPFPVHELNALVLLTDLLVSRHFFVLFTAQAMGYLNSVGCVPD